MGYSFRGFELDDYWVDKLDRYAADGEGVGGFLYAVLSNDLSMAVGHADGDNLKVLPAFIGYAYNRIPSQSWGSAAKVDAWQEAGGLNGLKRAAAAALAKEGA